LVGNRPSADVELERKQKHSGEDRSLESNFVLLAKKARVATPSV